MCRYIADWISTVVKLAMSGTPQRSARSRSTLTRSLPARISLATISNSSDSTAMGVPRLLGHPHDRLIQRLPRLDADQHQVQGIGKAVGDLGLAGLLAPRDPVDRQVIADRARHQDRQHDVRDRGLALSHQHDDQPDGQEDQPQRHPGEVIGADRRTRPVAGLDQLQPDRATAPSGSAAPDSSRTAPGSGSISNRSAAPAPPRPPRPRWPAASPARGCGPASRTDRPGASAAPGPRWSRTARRTPRWRRTGPAGRRRPRERPSRAAGSRGCRPWVRP
ncbi:MAG: hypothetical protein KatS3mg118_1929 [Paracoccaceae bacterium]|nr:MAG: hypothetical protein KatS3mg118_1929 [Paracoccaceae bacterium]